MTAAKVLGLENRRRTTTEVQVRDRHLDRKYIGDQVGFLKQMPSMGGDGRITCRKFKVAAAISIRDMLSQENASKHAVGCWYTAVR
jgi:hypothetical protein